MDTLALSQQILASLQVHHARTYWNRSPQSPVFPYIVYRFDSINSSTPSTDYYLNVDIFENINVSTVVIEQLADEIQNELDNKVLRTDDINLHLVIEQRQFISSADLTTAQMVNLRFVVRAYFIEE